MSTRWALLAMTTFLPDHSSTSLRSSPMQHSSAKLISVEVRGHSRKRADVEADVDAEVQVDHCIVIGLLQSYQI